MKTAADPITIGIASHGCAAVNMATAKTEMPRVVENQRPRNIAAVNPAAIPVNEPSPSFLQAWAQDLWY
jgi:hypothetical protein